MAGNVPGPPMAYGHPFYARSLAEFGTPRELPRSGGHILVRDIPGTPHRDAMGCYPLFLCGEWAELGGDLAALGPDLVSLTLVTDPFAPVSPDSLTGVFARVRHFKDHFVADLAQPMDSFVSRHHRYGARRALKDMEVIAVDDPPGRLEEWTRLYDVLIARHHLAGIKAFSRPAFALQLAIPGTVMLMAIRDGEVLGAQIWYRSGEVAYNHLLAVSAAGYTLYASYALYFEALRIFRERFGGQVRYLDLGAGAGSGPRAADGLSVFKRGWANATRPVYLCGRVFDPARYQELVRATGTEDADYFPAYRCGEFRATPPALADT